MVMSPDINIVEVKDVEVPTSDCVLSKYSTTLSLFVAVCERELFMVSGLFASFARCLSR